MKTEHIVLTISIQAAAALAKKRFVTSGGAVPAAGAWCPGVTNEYEGTSRNPETAS